jgi:fructokinase
MNLNIIGIGEVLWDMLPTGPQMGGAPANFTCHARALGAEAAIISRVGKDDSGEELTRRLAQLGVSTAGITIDPHHPTGTVDVEFGADGQPRYTIHESAAWDYLEASQELFLIASRAAAICYGTLGQRSETSRMAISSIVKHTKPEALRVYDVNLRQHFFSPQLVHESMLMANLVKLNEDELRIIAPMLGIIHQSPGDQLAALFDRYGLRLIACTRGGEGSLLFNGETLCEHSGLETRVVDTVGAGDSFAATITLGLLMDWPIGKISETANRIASHVCSCTGATPPMPNHLKALFQPAGQPA